MSNLFRSDEDTVNRALQDQNRQFEEKDTQARAKALHMDYISLAKFPIDLNVLAMWSEEAVVEAEAVPFFLERKELRLAVVNPQNATYLVKQAELSKQYNVKSYLVSKSSLHDALKFYAKVVRPMDIQESRVLVQENKDYIEDLKKIATGNWSASQILESIFGAALHYGSSDIHFEPGEKSLVCRVRIDGVLQSIVEISRGQAQSVENRIKILSKLKINVSNVPQDGRMTVYRGSEAIDVRVSSLPSATGEAFVLRLLGVGAKELQITDLDLRPDLLQILQNVIHEPNGLILNTGPTGSGKTTTLYACLRTVNKPGIKIITLEDPVEYTLPGVQQTPIDHRVNFDFAAGLRSVLRQDPDVVMVGEIRDPETAETSLQAALTGHLVFSTLHTNDAAGAIPRLLSMGLKPFIIAPALSLVIAQRLVRRLCKECREETVLPTEQQVKVDELIKTLPEAVRANVPSKSVIYKSHGCDVCHGLGYHGRIGVYEMLVMNERMRDLVFKNPSGLAVMEAAKADGFVTMAQDAVLKVLNGITDIDEVQRVVGL